MDVEDVDIQIVAGPSLPSQPFWSALHQTIETSYRNQAIRAFPASWKRLHRNPVRAANKLAEELGPGGYMAVIFQHRIPVACGGVVPFNGEQWVQQEADDATQTPSDLAGFPERPSAKHPVDAEDGGLVPAWEICCFCVLPDRRKQGLSQLLLSTMIDFVKARGARKLIAGWCVEEMAGYWPRLGFKPTPGPSLVLKAGFKHEPDMEGLIEDLHFAKGVKALT